MDATERIIRSLARRYANWRVPREDLEQEGRIAAWQAKQTFNGWGNLDAYIVMRVRGVMLHCLRDKSQLIRIPACQQEQGVLSPTIISLIDECDRDENQFATRDFAPFLIETMSRQDATPDISVPKLTVNQMQVLRLLFPGTPVKQVAAKLCTTEKSVYSQMTEIYKKLETTNLAEAIYKALAWGLLTPPEKIAKPRQVAVVLTGMEERVLTVLQAHPNIAYAAALLHISISTLHTHIRNARLKLGVVDMKTTIAEAARRKLILPPVRNREDSE
jgi:RNA polymerase sigma factor (sigma-70 family)